MNLELLQWGDGTIRLTYWDHMHGNDRVFLLDTDGRVYETTSIDEETETRTLVDLAAALRGMVVES